MKKTKLTRNLLAACSIVALTAVMYGCEGGHSDAELADAETAAAAQAQADAEAKAKAEADAAAKKAAAEKAAADARAAAEKAAAEKAEADRKAAEAAKKAAETQAKADADAAAKAKAEAEAAAKAKEEADAAAAKAKAEAEALAKKAEEEAKRMAEAAEEAKRTAAINAAQMKVTDAEAAVDALDDDATDEEMRDAYRMVEEAANALHDILRMNGGSDEAIEAAIRTSAAAKVAADARQAAITAAANAKAAAQRAAINVAEMALSAVEKARSDLGEDATDKETRDAHRAVERAAANLIQVLEDNGGTADQIADATMTRDSAKMMADDLTSPIEIADQRQAITDALSTLASAVASVNDKSSDAEVMAADNAVAAARKAIADATELPVAETMAHSMVVKAHANALATAKASRQVVVDKAKEAERMAMREAANKVALSKRTAITSLVAGSTARPFDGTDAAADADPSATDNYRLTVKRTGSAVEVTVVDGALSAKNDPMFEQAAKFGNGQMLVRNIGTDRKIIVVHTDIDAPEDTPFSQAPGITLDEDTDTDYTGNESIRIQSTATAANYFDGMASSRFMHSGDADSHTITFRIADSTATPPVAASKFSGTYDGAPGMYECTGSTACTVTVNDKDEVTAVAGDWNFTPASGAMVKVPDDDYLTFGFWLDTTTKGGAVATYDAVQTFATSSLDETTGTLDNVTGTATYNGDAAGVYVHETKMENGALDTATSGRFTADVALKAYFDDMTPFSANTIQGTIDNFALNGGPDNSWKVDVTATIGATFDLTGATKGGGAEGVISGQFHGEAVDRDGAGSGNDLAAPPVLVGEFNANFVNGAVAGAYGARKQD